MARQGGRIRQTISPLRDIRSHPDPIEWLTWFLNPRASGMQIDLNSPFREPQGLTTLMNSDQIDSGNPASSVRDKKTLLGVVVN
jgi:hypothetical protein